MDAVVFFEEEKVATAEAWGRHARFAFEVSPQGNGAGGGPTDGSPKGAGQVRVDPLGQAIGISRH